MIDELDLAAYLTSKGVQTYRANGSEITAHCWFCNEPTTKGKGKLYFNVESWLWQCKKCDARGNRRTLLEHFGDTDGIEYAAGSDPAVRHRILREAVDLAHEALLNNDDMLEYLFNRGLSEQTIVTRRFGYVPKSFGLSASLPCREHVSRADLIGAGLMTVRGSEFFNQSLLIPYFSHGTVVQIRERQMFEGGVYRTAGGDSSRLYNRDALAGATDVIVVEGEFDAAILEQHLRASGRPELLSTAVVGLAGVGSWPEGFLQDLDSVNRVFIGFDPDTAGRTYGKKLANEVGSRARMLELTDQLPKCDWSAFLGYKSDENPHGGHGWSDVADMLIDADMAGKSMFSVAEAGLKWSRLRTENPGIKTGFTGLDAVIRPGITPGQVVIPLARTGTGKSVFLSNLAHNMRSHRVLYISLELTTPEVFEHLRRIHKFWFPNATTEQRNEDYRRLRIVDQNRMARGGMQRYIEEYAEDVGAAPEVVIVDYLQYYARGFPGAGQYEKVSDSTMELKAVSKENGLASIVPSQVSRKAEDGKPLTADDSRDSGVIEETADLMFSLYRPDQVFDRNADPSMAPVQNGGVNLGILKSRRGGKGRVFNFRLSLMSLVIVDSLDRKAMARVEQENALYRQGVHYEDYRKHIDGENGQETLL